MKTNTNKNSLRFAALAFVLATAATAVAQVEFNFYAPTITGSGGNMVARYNNIGTLPDSTNVDMVAEILQQTDNGVNHVFTWKDGIYNDNIASYRAWQFVLIQPPSPVGTITEATVKYKFVVAGTNTPVLLDSFSFETDDLDEHGNRTEYFIASNYVSYQTNSPTNLEVSLSGNTLTAKGTAYQDGEPESGIRLEFQSISEFIVTYRQKRNGSTGSTQTAGYVGGDADIAFTAVADPEVGDLVWSDINGNGLQEPSEPGIGGVSVALRDAATNALVDQTTTDANGAYTLSATATGTHYLEFGSITGMVPSDPNVGSDDHIDSDVDPLTMRTSNFEVLAGVQPQYDAGFRLDLDESDLTVTVMADTDGDDLPDLPLADIEVVLFVTAGLIYPTDGGTIVGTTDASGQVSFEHLPEDVYNVIVNPNTLGSYIVPISDPDGVETAYLATVNLTANESMEFVFAEGFAVGSSLSYTYHISNSEPVPVTASFTAHMSTGVRFDASIAPESTGGISPPTPGYLNESRQAEIPGLVVPPGDSTLTLRTEPLSVHGLLSASATLETAADSVNFFRALTVSQPVAINVPAPPADQTPPRVTLFTANNTVDDDFTVSVIFSEDITGFTAAGISVANGTVSELASTSSMDYSFLVTPTAEGPVTIYTVYGAAQDSTGNDSTASNLLSITYAPPVYNPPVFLEEDFESGTGSFTYMDNAFKNTSQGYYASGVRKSYYGKDYSGGVRVKVGGVNGNDKWNMSGGYKAPFSLNNPDSVTVSFDYLFDMKSAYENDEYSEVLVSIDGQLYGSTGSTYVHRDYGGGYRNWTRVTVSLGELAAGAHEIRVGLFNNKKTTSSEYTYLYLDNIIIE